MLEFKEDPMSRFVKVCFAVAISLLPSVARAMDPGNAADQTPSGSFVVHEDLWDAMSDEPSQQLGLARQAYLSVDLGDAAKRLRKAAANLRITSSQADETSKPRLDHSADELDSLAGRVETGRVRSVSEIDRPSALALQRLSRYHYLMAERLWLQKRVARAGKQLPRRGR